MSLKSSSTSRSFSKCNQNNRKIISIHKPYDLVIVHSDALFTSGFICNLSIKCLSDSSNGYDCKNAIGLLTPVFLSDYKTSPSKVNFNSTLNLPSARLS